MNWQQQQRGYLLEELQCLSTVRVNDCVKLAYLTEEQMDLIDKLDLRALTEFKRSNSGVVEVKFMDRTKVLDQLLLQTEPVDKSIESILEVIGGGTVGDKP